MPFPPATEFPIDPQKIGSYPTLGEGVWGSVVDLGDGTVLKLARETCVGIGSGREKIKCEFETLCALHGQGELHSLTIPRALGYGEIPGSLHPDPTLWLQTTKVPGYTLAVRKLESFDREATVAIASSVGTALASLQRALGKALPTKPLSTASESLRKAQSEFGDDSQASKFAAQIQAALDASAEKPVTMIHGDFNISNILFENNQVKSIVDFAETRCGFYEEDLAAIVAELPAFRAPLVDAFEKASGYGVSGERLLVALATFELFTFAISGRQKNFTERSGSQEKLLKLVDQFS